MVWANNPFPVSCNYEVTQDDEGLKSETPINEGSLAEHVANLMHQEGKFTTILVRYHFSEEQFAKVKQYTPPPNRAFSFPRTREHTPPPNFPFSLPQNQGIVSSDNIK
jgi:hypothetical protein